MSEENIHIYDWLDLPAKDDNEAAAKKWLNAFTLPAINRDEKWLEKFRCSAVWSRNGKRMHVSGASRMGDVWLRNERSSAFYDHRVAVEELSDWMCVALPINPYTGELAKKKGGKP